MAAKAAAASDDGSLVLDNWEDIEESGILDRNLVQADSSPEEPDIMSSGPSARGVILLPPRRHPPGVKILQRPSRSPVAADNGDARPRAAVKTLQQREREYAEARLRILGSARSPDEAVALTTHAEQRVSKIVAKASRPDDAKAAGKMAVEEAAEQRVSKVAAKMDALRAGEAGLVRLPRGPDGSRGFKLRR